MRIATKQINKAFSLIDVVLGIAILSVSTLTLYSLYNFSLKVLWENKTKVTATQIANQKMELVRNLPYNQIGLAGGIPAGPIEPNETVARNGIEFNINTSIIYIDDPFDGVLGGNPDDLLNTDYKRVRISITWPTRLSYKPVVFLTDVSPNGLETNVGGGTLSLTVFNASGEAVPQAAVHIENSTTNPVVNFDTLTNNQGKVILPGTPAATNSYQIIVTKNGYSTDGTITPSLENPAPDKPPLSVFENQITNASFSIDLTSTINVLVKDQLNNTLGDLLIKVKGDKTIGKDGGGSLIYKYNQNHQTGSQGEINLTELEWDSYTFTIPTSTAYSLAESFPLQPINLLPNSSTDLLLTAAPQASDSLLVIVQDVEANPLADATVRLYNQSLGLDETLTTSSAGQSYFSPWQNATSTLLVTKSGYLNYQIEVTINGYVTEQVIMTVP